MQTADGGVRWIAGDPTGTSANRRVAVAFDRRRAGVAGGTMADPGEATVLVVDDEVHLAELFEAFLADDYDVRTATSGAEALQTIDDDVDVVLLDRRMPDMSGDEVLAELSERGYDVRVAMLTGVEPDINIVDMPFDDYKTKPIDRAELLALVEVLLRRSTYDECSQLLFSLASKKRALEMAGHDDTDEYRELVDRMEGLRDEIDVTLDEMVVT